MISYFQVLESYGFKPKIRTIWISVGMPNKEFGWKLHLSSIQIDVIKLLELVLPIFQYYSVPFKIAKDANVLAELNEGAYGETQIGKFCTIYPENDDSAREIASALINATSNLRGPKIVTDLYLGNIVYCRYGTFNPQFKRDRLGALTYSKHNKNADYKIPFEVPIEMTNPFEGLYTEIKKFHNTKSRIIGSGYLVIETIQKRAKGSIFKALDLREQHQVKNVVLKEGVRYCMSDIHGRDICDRLYHQKHILSKLTEIENIPKAEPVFEFENNVYLPLEFIEGVDYERKKLVPYYGMESIERHKCLNQFKELIEIVDKLHDRGIIHRDITPRNVRLGIDEKIWLIDFELAFDINEDNLFPFMQGTPGYMSPQQKLNQYPTFSDDIYSLGAFMLMVLTGFDTRKLLYSRSHGNGFVNKIHQLSGIDISFAEILNNCLAEQPNERPTIQQLKTKINQLITTCQNKIIKPQFDIADLQLTIESGIRWLSSPQSKDPVIGLWFSPEIQHANNEVTQTLPPKLTMLRSQSRGVSGVIYTLCRLHRMGYSSKTLKYQINQGIDWLIEHNETSDDQMPGLHFGEAGVAVAIAEAVNSKIIGKEDWMKDYFSEVFSSAPDWPDITHGAAGQGIATMICADLLNNNRLSDNAHIYANYLIQTQKSNGSWLLPEGVESLKGVSYTGFAHGISGILYFLLKYAEKFDSKSAADAATLAADWLLNNSKVDNRGFRFWPIQSGSSEVWHWWCHGGPGIALAFMALYQYTKNMTYRKISEEALTVHPYYIRHGNLSQCHGLSGLGEIYLEAYKILGNPQWLSRATEIGITLISLSKNDENGSSWLVENPHLSTSDLMIGNGGILHFLGRLSSISKGDIGFPLLI